MLTVTDDDLTRLIDPAIAVERALTAAEEGAFKEHILMGADRPADWIDTADNCDTFCGHIEEWWRQAGSKTVDYMRVRFELPEPLIRRLVIDALIVAYALMMDGVTIVGQNNRKPVEIACGAALWARGYAEGMGWQPTYPPPAGAS